MEQSTSEMRLFDKEGRRLYLNHEERAAFLSAAAERDPIQRAFVELLVYSGCRISEGLAVPVSRVDLSGHNVTFRTLKKRRGDVYRAVPLPPDYVDSLQRTFSLRKAQKRKNAHEALLFPWSRRHGWKITTDIMKAADIAEGPHRTPKGLRHAYGIRAILKGVPVTQLQKWMGHAQLSTTSIYLDFQGEEAADLAARMWT
ncbi:MAG: site-specific integrase [Henriciella sp.]